MWGMRTYTLLSSHLSPTLHILECKALELA